MTVFEIRIDRLVLRDLPPQYREGLDDAIVRAIGAAAAGAEERVSTRDPIDRQEQLARQIGRQVWTSVRGSRP
jgi:hypothetical protein